MQIITNPDGTKSYQFTEDELILRTKFELAIQNVQMSSLLDALLEAMKIQENRAHDFWE